MSIVHCMFLYMAKYLDSIFSPPSDSINFTDSSSLAVTELLHHKFSLDVFLDIAKLLLEHERYRDLRRVLIPASGRFLLTTIAKEDKEC